MKTSKKIANIISEKVALYESVLGKKLSIAEYRLIQLIVREIFIKNQNRCPF